jgi:type II secretory pathway predicted ATPase ExeA
MKKIAILALSAFMMTSVAAFGAEQTKEQKDQCLLASKECRGEVDSIQKKMKKLEAEIKKGKRVYTPEELKALQMKLDEADKLLDNLTKP